MKIVIPIISISWHGGTRVLVQLGNFLAELGHEVVFLVSRNRCKTPFDFAPGVTVRHVGIHTGLKLIDYAVFLCCVPFLVSRSTASNTASNTVSNTASNTASNTVSNTGTNTAKSTVLIANFFVSYYPVRLLALIKGLPYIYFVQDIESKYRSPGGVILNALCNWTYRDRRIVAASAHLRNRLMDEFGTSSRNIAIGPDRIFYELPATTAKKYDIVYFLRSEIWKGLDRFQRFLALTDGRLSCLCVSQDEELQGSIAWSSAVFRRPKNDRELVDCMDSARILLLTSYREGFALPPLEGMARGLPTVLFRCGGPDQYAIDGRNAIYVDSEAGAAHAVEKLIADPVMYERMRQEAILTAAEYRLDRSFASMAAFIGECSQW